MSATTTLALEARQVSKHYAGHTALDGVSVAVPQGRIFGLLGPNGAGKTSLIRIVNQITAPDGGSVHFFGAPLQREHIAQIGYLPEERGLYKKMKVGEQCLYLAQLKGLSRSDAANALRHWFTRFEIEGWWNKKVEELSKGMAQKVQFITTVLHKPRLLILDEPFSGFDPINAALVRDEILAMKNNGTTIMLSTHNMGSVEEICDDIALINQAKTVLAGEVKTIRQQYREHLFEIVFRGEMLNFTNALWAQFELVDHRKTETGISARIRLLRGATLNQLLEVLLPVVQLEEVREVLPTMNDIFIRAVKGDATIPAGSQSTLTE